MRHSRLLTLLPAFAILAACGNSTPAGTCTAPDGGAAAQTCNNPIGVSEAPASQVQHLGTIKVGQAVAFDVPLNTASVTIVEQAVSAPLSITYQPPNQSSFTLDNTAVPLEIRDPSGKTLYDDNPTSPVTDPTAIARQPVFFGSNSPAIGTITIPNTTGGLTLVSSTGLPNGSWTMTISDYAYECTFTQPAGACCAGGSTSSVYDVTVITKPISGSGIPTSGNLDVVVYFATTIAPLPTGANKPLSAATANAGNDPDLNRMQQTLTSLLSNAGIAVRSVTYVDLPPDVQATYATGVNVDQTGGCSAVAKLLTYGKGGNTLNIFFVSSFIASDLSAGNTVVGLDGTIPGPATVGGSIGSGAAVATHDLRTASGSSACSTNGFNVACGADITAYIIAHEAGHFLGLYHVTESDGTAFDPLIMTPMCPCASCNTTTEKCASSTATSTSATHNMTVAECTKSTFCGGGDNLMFWLLDTGSQGTLLDEQQRVMRANPLIQ